MIRENPSRWSRSGSLSSSRFPLIALIAAATVASALACSSDDEDNDTESLPLEPIEPVQVDERETPPAPAEGSNTPVEVADTPNGLQFPSNIANWSVVGVTKVLGEPGTVRVILGNDLAVDAARLGPVDTWPEGSMLGHIQWSADGTPSPGSTATVPGNFAAVTLMVKDSDEYAADGGWAYGAWASENLTPPAAGFDRNCVNCHTMEVADKDMVFTIPGALPTQAAVTAAPVQPNGVELPAGILDWKIISIASRETDMPAGNIRVVVGNDIAVDAARSGETNPWPDGAMLAHYVWASGDNPDAPDTINPIAFNAITLMVKDSGAYGADGGWAYGVWSTADLTAAAPDFDRACVNCHTSNVANNDFVFTKPGSLPDALLAP